MCPSPGGMSRLQPGQRYVLFAWYGWTFAGFGLMQRSEMSGINMLSIYAAFPMAGVTWAVFLLEKIVGDVRLISGQEKKADA